LFYRWNQIACTLVPNEGSDKEALRDRLCNKDGSESAEEHEEIAKTVWMIIGWQKSQKMKLDG